MIYLVLTPAGLKALENSGPALGALWLSAGVATPVELADLRARGAEVTEFTQRIDSTNTGAVAQALDTIGQHHPNQPVWVEHGVDA